MRSGPDLHDPRRSPRLRARCAVRVRHRLSRWRAETEDLGPDGCQLVSNRLVASGREVRLKIEVPGLDGKLERIATVVWRREAQPSRLGLRFEPDRFGHEWFEGLVAADTALPAPARRGPSHLPWQACLHLGTPPRLIVDFTRDELAILTRLRPGMPVVELVAGFGSAPDRLVGALFALVARRQIVLDPAESPGAEAWRDVLARAQAIEAAEGLTPERHPPPSGFHRLLAEGRYHLAAGRMALAAQRFREARALAPDDREARAELGRLGRFA
jgi:hypothetical protein